MGITDPETGTIIDMNQAFENWSGYNRSEFIGSTTFELGAWKSEEERLLFINKIADFGEVDSIEIKIRIKNGELRDVLLFARQIHIDDRSFILAHFHDITVQRQMERELREHRKHLEELVRERTSSLTNTVELLGREVEERIKSEAALRSREIDLEERKQELEEMNAALKVLLKQRNEDKADIEKNILATVKTSILPYIEKMNNGHLSENQKKLLHEIEFRLEEITSPFVRELSSEYLGLSPNEIRVASLVKEGKTSKEIAQLLTISAYTVMSHRRSIREKTALKGKSINLRSYLQTLK